MKIRSILSAFVSEIKNPLWFGHLIGMPPGCLLVQAQAHLEEQVEAFRGQLLGGPVEVSNNHVNLNIINDNHILF